MPEPKNNKNAVNGMHSHPRKHAAAIPVKKSAKVHGTARAQTTYKIPQANLKGGAMHANANLNKRLNRRGNTLGASLIGALVIALFVAGGLVYWFNRPVNISVNEKTVALKKDTPIQDAISAAKVEVKPGKLLAVDGSTIDEKGGWSFSAKVNGEELSSKDASEYKIKADDKIEITDGADKTEDYEVTNTAIENPKLAMDGNAGSIGYISQWGYPGKTETRKGKTSGITSDVQVQEVQNVVVKLHTPRPKDNQKLVALTFDDGPSEYTQRYLDILKQYNAKATFFTVGYRVEESPEIAKAVVDAGMQIASHTYDHPLLTSISDEAINKTLVGGFDAIKNATGVDTTVLRAPYGGIRQSTWLKTKGLVSYNVLWSQDSEDWRKPGKDAIIQNSLAGVTSGSIILFHDGGGNRDQDLEALPEILKTLSDKGYTFVTLDELLASDDEFPKDLSSGNETMPADSVWPTELATN